MALRVGQSKYKEGVMGDFYTRNITSKTKIEFFGNWEGVSKIFESLPKELQKNIYTSILLYTTKYKNEVIRTIRRNGPKSAPWEPYFSGAYLAYKLRVGRFGIPAFYRLRGVLIKAIELQTDGRKVVRVTVSKKYPVKNSNGELNTSQLMNILEHGSVARGITARPLFGPVWTDMGGNRALRDFVSARIGKRLKKYTSSL